MGYRVKTYDELTFTDDFLFCRIMENEEICRGVIERLLDIEVGKIEFLSPQKSVDTDFTSHGVRFDVYVRDSDKIFDVEIQTRNTGDLSLRSRYYQSQMDIDSLSKGISYRELKQTYIIFLCTFDPFKKSLPVYTVRPKIEECPDARFDDKSERIFYNINEYGKVTSKERQSLLKYLATRQASSGFTARLEREVHTAKGNEPWRKKFMTLEMKMQDIRQEGKEEGFTEGRFVGKEEGAFETAIKTAKRLLAMGLSLEQVAQGTSLSVEQVQQLQQDSAAVSQN